MPLGQRFARYFNPTLAALRDLGGSARPGEVFESVAEQLGLTEEELNVENQSGGSRFENDVAWTRFYLVRGGLVDSSKRGVWSLTEKGQSVRHLSDDEISGLIRRVQAPASDAGPEPTADQIERRVTELTEQSAPTDATEGYREQTLQIMQSLPPTGFERLCQRLLRESGFQQVRVTGKSGDGGIDGIGILQINAFVSFKVLFQCKRWAHPVGTEIGRAHV